jgi:hypothetical protein
MFESGDLGAVGSVLLKFERRVHPRQSRLASRDDEVDDRHAQRPNGRQVANDGLGSEVDERERARCRKAGTLRERL